MEVSEAFSANNSVSPEARGKRGHKIRINSNFVASHTELVELDAPGTGVLTDGSSGCVAY